MTKGEASLPDSLGNPQVRKGILFKEELQRSFPAVWMTKPWIVKGCHIITKNLKRLSCRTKRSISSRQPWKSSSEKWYTLERRATEILP
jgi:hypothetical protein